MKKKQTLTTSYQLIPIRSYLTLHKQFLFLSFVVLFNNEHFIRLNTGRGYFSVCYSMFFYIPGNNFKSPNAKTTFQSGTSASNE